MNTKRIKKCLKNVMNIHSQFACAEVLTTIKTKQDENIK